MRRTAVVLGLAFLFAPLAVSAQTGFKGGGRAVDDFASYNIKNIGLLIIGKWKGSEAKVEPSVIAMNIKSRLREKGYDIFDLNPRNKKMIKAAGKTQDAILKIAYQSTVSGRVLLTSGEHIDRAIKGTAVLETTKRITKKKKVVFRSRGQTYSQISDAGDGEHVLVANAPREFSAIIADLPAIIDSARKEDAATEEKKNK